MQICKDKVVTIHYVLRGDDNQVIDDSHNTSPLQYIHGNNYLLHRLSSTIETRPSVL